MIWNNYWARSFRASLGNAGMDEIGYIGRRFIGVIVGAALAFATMASTRASEVYEIRQIIDMKALVPEDLYRFVPNYYWIKPNDTIRFLNSTGNHTVKSIPGIWPDGAEPIDIAHQSSYDVKLSVPGVYGFRCKVHARHGMFALIIVGRPEPNLNKARNADLYDRARNVFDELFVKLDADRKTRDN